MKFHQSALFKSLYLLAIGIFFITVSVGCKEKPTTEQHPDFEYLSYEDDVIKSVHAIELALKIPDGYRGLEPLNHQPTFNDHDFNVSVTALLGDKHFIMVHAEMVTDTTGYLDYSYMKPDSLSGFKFYSKEDCVELTEEILKEAADVKYVQDNGFEVYPALYLKQYFQNTSDGNSEYVLSFITRVNDCSEQTITEAFKTDFYKTIKETIILTSE